MSKTLLIVGSTGLIGSACKRYFKGNYRLLSPSREELNATDKNNVETYFKKERPDYVILAAGLVGGIQFNQRYPADLITENLMMQLTIFEAANRISVKRLIFFASSCMYPKFAPQPMEESSLFTGPLEPTSLPYATAKLAGMQMAKAYNAQYQTDRFITLIPNTVYGPHDEFNPEKGHVIPSLITRFHAAKMKNHPSITLWGDGSPRREFLHANDLARIAHLALDHSSLPPFLNVGVGYDITIKKLAKTIQEVVGYSGKIEWDLTKSNGAPRKLLNSEKLRALGFQPSITFEEGIAATYEWYLKHDQIPI